MIAASLLPAGTPPSYIGAFQSTRSDKLELIVMIRLILGINIMMSTIRDISGR